MAVVVGSPAAAKFFSFAVFGRIVSAHSRAAPQAPCDTARRRSHHIILIQRRS